MKNSVQAWAAGFAVAASFGFLTQCQPQRHAAAPEGVKGELSSAASQDVLTVGDTLIDLRTLPLEKRVALHSAEIRAGLSLWKAGHSAEAVTQLDAVLNAAPPGLIAGFDALAYESAALIDLRNKINAGEPASEHAEAIDAANAAAMARLEASGGSVSDIVTFLVTICVVEYRTAVSPSDILDAKAYASAWGRAQIAHDLIAARVEVADHPSADALLQAQLLVRLWPREGPVLDRIPAPLSLVDAQAARVNLEAASLSD
jgi:hypothetical protein